MEDTTMTKKEYLKPAMEICQVDTVQMLAGSLTSVNTTGLDEAIDFDDTSEDSWEFAW